VKGLLSLLIFPITISLLPALSEATELSASYVNVGIDDIFTIPASTSFIPNKMTWFSSLVSAGTTQWHYQQ